MPQPSASSTPTRLGSYVPDLVRAWSLDAPPYREVEGSLVSADISGFTALSERLAGYGRRGAETLTALLNQCFGGMIDIIDAHGGDVLKFGGDALLVLFTGDEHATRAAAACSKMRRLIERTWTTDLVKRVRLGISQGVHSGTFHLHLVDAGFRELLVVGPGMSATVRCEGAAERGQVLLSHDAAALLGERDLGATTPEGRVLAREPRVDSTAGEPAPRTHHLPESPIDAFVPEWLVEQVAAGRVAEHRVVTVGFVFFGGVDDLLAAEGPAKVHERLQALASITQAAADRHGVYWLASDVYAGGGKIILAAGAPRSTGHDEDAAVRTAREILDADVGLPLRGGLNRGPVFMGDLGSDRRCTFTVMGDTVNLAARLMQKSGTGQLVASQAVLDHVPTPFLLDPLEPFLVKGKSEPIEASLVGSQLADDAEPVTAEVPVRFVGRHEEMAHLVEALDAARHGHGRVVDVVGEPGIGKSRLVSEFLTAHGDVRVLHANGGLYARNTPYFAVSTMLRRLIGVERSASAADAGHEVTAWLTQVAPDLVEWAPLLAIAFDAEVPMTPTVRQVAPANRANRLRDVVVDVLTRALDGTTVFVIDDAHRLDEASEGVLGTIALRVTNRPWLVLALRHDHAESFASSRDGVDRLMLGPLSDDDTRALARAALAAQTVAASEDDADAIVARGVTNPLFLIEMVKAGVGGSSETPGSIEAVVTAHIDTLGAADRLLLREAAVLGSVVDTEVLAEVTGQAALRNPTRWRALSGFLRRDADGRLRFQHGLYRDVAYGGLSFDRRRNLHAAVAQTIERRAGGGASEQSELLSLHFHQAGDWDRSWRYSVQAGDRARSKYAHAEAAQFYRRALEVPPGHRPSREAVAEVAESLADALEVSGRFEDADGALALARRFRREPDATVRLIRKQGVIRERQGRYPQALRWYGRGLQQAEAVGDPAARAKAEGELALAYAGVRFRQGRMRDCIEWAHRAESIGREFDNRQILAHASYLLMIGYGVLRLPEAAHYRDVPLPLFEELDDLVGQANVLNNLGVDAKEEGRWSDALDLYERSRIARVQVGDVIGAATATINIAEILSDQGYLDRAEPLFQDALRSFRRAGYPVGVAVTTSYLGRLQARRGEYDDARAMMADAAAQFAEMGAAHFVLETRVFQLEADVLAAGDQDVPERAGPLRQQARELGDPLLEVMTDRIEGWTRLRQGEFDDAARLAQRCLDGATALGATYEQAMALVLRGLIARATGSDPAPDHAQARTLLEGLGVVALARIAGEP